MQFGLLLPPAALTPTHHAGFDYLEYPAPLLLQGQEPDDTKWTGPSLVQSSPLPCPVCDSLLPPTLSIAGLTADPFALHAYLETTVRRAQLLSVHTLVLSAGPSIPDDFDRPLGLRQIIDFLEISTALAARHHVTLALQPLPKNQSNVLNTLAECAAVARSLNHPRLKLLLDAAHARQDPPTPDTFPLLAHVHLPPGNHIPLFHLLKRNHYSGTMSLNAPDPEVAPRVLESLRAQWQEA